MPYSYFEWLQGFFAMHSTIGSTEHSFEQFWALYMHNHDDKYPARPPFEPGGYKPQSIRMSNRDRTDPLLDQRRRRRTNVELFNCFYCIFRHLKLELLTQFPASNDKKYIFIWNIAISQIEFLN